MESIVIIKTNYFFFLSSRWNCTFKLWSLFWILWIRVLEKVRSQRTLFFFSWWIVASSRESHDQQVRLASLWFHYRRNFFNEYLERAMLRKNCEKFKCVKFILCEFVSGKNDNSCSSSQLFIIETCWHTFVLAESFK